MILCHKRQPVWLLAVAEAKTQLVLLFFPLKTLLNKKKVSRAMFFSRLGPFFKKNRTLTFYQNKRPIMV